MPLAYKEPTPLPLQFIWTNELEKIQSWRNNWGGLLTGLPSPFWIKNTILFKKKKQNNKKVHFLNKIAIFIQMREGAG